MPTVIFDATGNRQAINGALDYLAHGGRYILVGLQKGDLCFNHPEFHKRETTLMSSRNALREDFEFVVSCIDNKTLKVSNLITNRLAFNNLEHQFKDIIGSKELVVKAMIEFGEVEMYPQVL
jgi:threonine dehydrogenase-like Zn-dependent dehydrogenase